MVAAVVAGRAAFMVTLDRHPLEVGGLPGALVLRPGDFLRERGSSTDLPFGHEVLGRRGQVAARSA